MHFVAALDRVAGMRGVLCLFEGVCSGAADGYARVTGRPAATLLHLGPGLGNSLANFHNARKARTPIVSVVGEHATAHLKVDAPLTSDVQAFARTVSQCVRTVGSPDACGPPGQIAMLIVPADHSWSSTEAPVVVREARRRPVPNVAAIDLHKPGTALLLGGTAVSGRALEAAGRISAATGVRVIIARNAPIIASGSDRFQPLPLMADVRQLILVESEPPVSFFAYPDTPSEMTPASCSVITLASRAEDGTAALEALADEAVAVPVTPWSAVEAPMGDAPLTLDSLGLAVAAYLPENALVSDEMVSSSPAVQAHLRRARPHDFIPVTGGSIGQGLPVALGAAMAAPDRKVVALEADGSAMYTLQALWTIARENLDVTVVIFNNRRYRILDIEMQRTGANGFGSTANDMIDIGRPDLDFVKLAEGCGVAASRAATEREFSEQFRDAMNERGPRVIEALLI
jgi:acetolactate synthase-1/2/3 large subunit